MLKFYGSMLCPDCVACRKAYDDKNIGYTYLDIGENLANLKEFLSFREREAFESVRREGKIGIPCIVTEADEVVLDWELLLKS